MILPPNRSSALLVAIVLGVSSVAAVSSAQNPPSPPPRPDDASPPPRPGDAPPPPRAGDRAPPPKPGSGGRELTESNPSTQGARSVTGEVWADNWFKLYINGAPLIEDSVPITTERSFNAERFAFQTDYPMTIAFEFRDFMENSTGLEYIGTRRQQMGDGGAIAQFRDVATGKLLAATGSDWRCITVQSAPQDRSCERESNPATSLANCAETLTPVSGDWMTPGFDDSAWPGATVHSASAVRPKGGYDQVKWDPAAKLIWGPDLQKDNIVYCRITVGG